MLENILGEVRIDPSLTEPDPNLRPKAPGMKYTHYAPKGELTIVEAMDRPEGNEAESAAAVADTVNALCRDKEALGFTVAVLATAEHVEKYTAKHVITVGNEKDGATVAARLYAALRECDDILADYIYSEAFTGTEISGAIMNRLIKAAGHQIITA